MKRPNTEGVPGPEGRERLLAVVKNLRAKYGTKATKLGKANEAATRLLVIDEVLVALGWSKGSFHPESRTQDGSYIDYKIELDGHARFIVEAKRIGHTFSPASKKLRRTEYLLSYMRQAFGASLTEVLDQAERYCRETLVPFAILTNGAEWVVAQVIPPAGVEEEKLRCYYVGNVFDESANLDLLWELLSASAVAEGQIEEAFSRINSFEAEYCVEPRSLIGELRWGPLPDRPHLDDFYHCFFDEIIDQGRRKMLEHCYVTSPRLDQYEGELKRTLVDTAPAYLDDAVELAPGETRRVLPDGSGDQKGRVVLVVGSVGAGKSTFVTKTLIENRSCSLVFIKLDLINEAVLHEDSPPDRLWGLLRDSWGDKKPDSLHHGSLRQAFHRELEALRRGPSAAIFDADEARYKEVEALRLQELVEDAEHCLRRLWRYEARQHGTRVVVFLDNVDRSSEAFQHRMYAFAHAVAAETGATVIVTMRESTYYRAKESGFLDVRTSDKVFHLQAPNVVQLVSRRVQYVEKYMEEDHRARSWKRDKDWPAFQQDCRRYAESLKQSFLVDSSGQDLLAVLSALAWHNIRAFLATLRRTHFLIAEEDERWPESRVLGALLAGDTSGSLRAIPATLYRPPTTRHSCFLLKLRVLLLLKVGVKQLEQRQGVTYPRLIEFGRIFGYRRSWIEMGIVELVRERLMECLQIPSELEHTSTYELDEAHRYKLSPLGVLVVEQIQFHPTYLSASAWELPYHSKKNLDAFLDAASNALLTDDLSQCELEGATADLLAESELPRVVAEVLRDARDLEVVPEHHLTSRPDAAAVEERLRVTLGKIEVPVESNGRGATSRGRSAGASVQTCLPIGGTPSDPRTISVPVPANIKHVKIHGSTTGPAIFWALVFAHVNALGPQSGADLTRLINEHLRDDYERLENTNVSRCLRSRAMQQQAWLSRSGEARRYRFELAEDWREQWREVFDTQPPA